MAEHHHSKTFKTCMVPYCTPSIKTTTKLRENINLDNKKTTTESYFVCYK